MKRLDSSCMELLYFIIKNKESIINNTWYELFSFSLLIWNTSKSMNKNIIKQKITNELNQIRTFSSSTLSR